MIRFTLLMLVLLLLLPAPGWSVKLQVEQDGSGEFSHIMHAVNAASAGDTILIGPGEYRNYISVMPPGFNYYVRIYVFVALPNLTFIGSGPADVVIGPEVFDPGYPANDPLGFMFIEGSDSWGIHGVTLENCLMGVATHTGGSISDCDFRGGDFGVSLFSEDELSTKNCEIRDHVSRGEIDNDSPGLNLTAKDYRFPNPLVYYEDGAHVQVSNCEFTGGGYGGNGGLYSVQSTDPGNDCDTSGDGCVIVVRTRSKITGKNNILVGANQTLYLYGPTLAVEFSRHQKLSSKGRYIFTQTSPGTEAGKFTGLGPFSTEPPPAATTWGNLASMFR